MLLRSGLALLVSMVAILVSHMVDQLLILDHNRESV
jgi:hypothetical protein